MAHQYLYNVNPYVEERSRYKSDSVKVSLDEATFTVTVFPIDTTGVVIEGASPIVTKTLTDLPTAVKYYNEMIHQLSQGDVIRNI
jgi:hypothetical protein